MNTTQNCQVREQDLIVSKSFTTTKSEVVDILAGNVPALGALLRIVDILPSEAVETASVTTSGAPIIYYNPHFVDEHCESKAHLAMLLLHEVYHVLMGHTLAKKNPTEVDNIVCDAIINAMICMQYPSFGFQSFFSNFYSKSELPQCFLRPRSRPPRFWQRRKYKQLYTVMGLPMSDLEYVIKECLPKSTNVTLLGSHSTGGTSSSSLPDTLLDQAAEALNQDIGRQVQRIQNERIRDLRHKKWRRQQDSYSIRYRYSNEDERRKAREKIQQDIDKLQQEIDQIKGIGPGASLYCRILGKRIEISKKRKELEEALKHVAQQSLYSKLEVKLKGAFPKIPETSVIPNYRNKRAIVSLVEGIYHPFFKNPLRPRDFGLVTIYIDVSASMDGFIPTIYQLACNCKEYLDETIYLFSTEVRPITKDQLLKGVVKSTGGTNDCFLTHALKEGKRKIMVFTDGYLRIDDRNAQELRSTGTRMIVAYTPNHSLLPKDLIYSELIMSMDGEAKLLKERDKTNI